MPMAGKYYIPETRDPLETIAKGLTIASQIYGIKEASMKHDELQRQIQENKENNDPNSEKSQAVKKALQDVGFNVSEKDTYSSLAPIYLELQKGQLPASKADIQKRMVPARPISPATPEIPGYELGPSINAKSIRKSAQDVENVDRAGNISRPGLAQLMIGGTKQFDATSRLIDVPPVPAKEAVYSQSAFPSEVMGKKGMYELPSDNPNLLEQLAAINLQREAGAAKYYSEEDRLRLEQEKLAETKRANKADEEIKKLLAEAAMNKSKAGGTKLSAGQKRIDTEFAQRYNDWINNGGFSTVRKNLELLKDARDKLKSGYAETGKTAGALGQLGRTFAMPKTTEVIQQAEQAVIGGMRPTFGPQFTEREGTNYLKRTINPSLPNESNIKSIDAIIREIEAKAIATDKAVKYWEEHDGTLNGYKSSDWLSQGERASSTGGEPNKSDVGQLGDLLKQIQEEKIRRQGIKGAIPKGKK